MKVYTLRQVEARLLGKIGTPDRDDYELRVKLMQFGQLIKEVRCEKSLSQEELGNRIGVSKSQISKLENGTSNMTLATIFKIFEAMKAELHFEVRGQEKLTA